MVIERKIKNKVRCSHRGSKQRYSVWRAEYNSKWEKVFRIIAETIRECQAMGMEEFHKDLNDCVFEQEQPKGDE